MALTGQNIVDAYTRFKRDTSDVGSGLFLEWLQFMANYAYKELKGIDATRFVQTESYNVTIPPQSFALPSDFMDLNQTECGLYLYDMRKRPVVSFDSTGDSGVTFSDSGGTSVYNSTIKVQGGSSRGFTGDAAATLILSWATNVDWTDFQDSEAASPNNDHISIWVYVGNTVPSSVTIKFSTSNAGTDVGANEFEYAYSSLVVGWNRIKVLKSAFTQTGSPDWSSLGYLRLTHTGGDATTNIYWDKLDLIENEINGNDQTSNKLGISGYGSPHEGYYLKGSNIVFTGASHIVDNYYVMRYIPQPPTLTGLDDYLTLDLTGSGQPIFENRHLEYTVKAMDVLYEQWDDDPSKESIADFRFVRALDVLLEGYNRSPQIAVMKNPINYF